MVEYGNLDIRHYARLFKGMVSKETCEKTVKQMNDIEFQEHTFYNPHTGKTAPRSGSQELEMSFSNNVTTKGELNLIVKSAGEKYVADIGLPWFQRFSGWSHVRFNKYSENKKMALHCDHIHSMFDGERKGIPILSVLGVLNNDYEGGDFVLFDNHKIDFEAGDILVFPSVFIYPHRVEPVTKGTRYSYISWIW